MARSSDFTGNFDNDSLNGGTWQEMRGSSNAGPKNEKLVLFNSDNPTSDSNVVSGGTYTIPSSLVGPERVNDFQASMSVVMEGSPYAPHGNKMPDGLSFNFGDTSSYRENPWRPDTFEYERGVTTGLSVAVIPYDSGSSQARGNLVIFWNGTVIASTPFSGKGDFNSSAVSTIAQTLLVSVTEDGKVTASLRLASLTVTIPNNEWKTTDQSGWDFAVAGRTGANGGRAYVDDIRLKSEILLCFVAGTLIDCERGAQQVETLQIGDLVMTRDNGPQPIRWIGRRKLSSDHLGAKPAHRPIRLTAGALGKGRPNRDLLISPQHRVLVQSPIAQRMFGTTEVLVSAKQLCCISGISIAEDITEVEYIHLMFDTHQIVTSNGAETESLYAGKQVLSGLNAEAITEILEIFPELTDKNVTQIPIRYLTTGREARGLARRHAANNKPLLMG